jgi:hypothetical protein
MAIVRDRPRQPPPAPRRQLFLSDEPAPLPEPTIVRARPVRAIVQFAAVAAVLACVGILVARSFGGAPPVVDPLRDAGVGSTGPAAPAAATPDRAAATPDKAPATPAPTAPAQTASPTDVATGALADLAGIRRGARSRLAQAKTAAPQAAAARELAAAYSEAAGKIERLDAERLAGLATALRAGERAYTGLAAAIAGGDQGEYDREAGLVRDAEADVARESSRLN